MAFQIKNIYYEGWRTRDFQPMPGSPAQAIHLGQTSTFSEVNVEVRGDDCMGADLIQLEAGESFPLHTHPGHHVLLVIMGQGTVYVNDVVHHTRAGDIYMVDGNQPHAVAAVERHLLLSIGIPHKMPAAFDRMDVLMEKSLVGLSEGVHLQDK